jgi:hypothetical protein
MKIMIIVSSSLISLPRLRLRFVFISPLDNIARTSLLQAFAIQTPRLHFALEVKCSSAEMFDFAN